MAGVILTLQFKVAGFFSSFTSTLPLLVDLKSE
jgi:hypothetical protein